MYIFIYGFAIFFSGKPERMEISGNTDVLKDPGADAAIKLGSTVEVTLAKGPTFATVRWIGSLPDMPSRMAGLELVLVNTDLFWWQCETH